MKKRTLAEMTVPQLVERFAEDALKQFKAELREETAEYNRLVDDILAVELELKKRPGDQRTALAPLLAHPNPQVRLMAAEVTLAVAPAAARRTLQELWDGKQFPQAAYAIGTLRALERGERKPS